MISITAIERNYNLLLRKEDYQEVQIFTKFEDSFLLGMDPDKSSGITLVHGSANLVTYPGASREVEIGDIRILMYSPKRYKEKGESQAFRQLFVQFKRYMGDKRSISIEKEQFELYSTHPFVSPGKKAIHYYESGILNKSISDDLNILHAGTMFASGYYKDGKANLKMMDSEPWRYPRPRVKNLWKNVHDTSFECKLSSDGYLYCTCISSMKELLLHMKEMEVGMPIGFDLIGNTIAMSNIPEDLRNMMNSNYMQDKNKDKNEKENEIEKEELSVSTIFINIDALNVDELEEE